MKTTFIMFDGVRYEVPVMPSGEPLHMPFNSIDEFPTYCGPGTLGDKLVPDDLYGVPVNDVCYIHDVTNALAETREEDHQSNEMFQDNLLAAIRHREPKPPWEDRFHHARLYRALTYYAAVDTVGLRDDVTGETV